MPPTSDALRDLLRGARTIAVVGLSPRAWRPSHSVSAYLQRAGYRIIPVRPDTPGTILGEEVYPDLVTAAREAGPVDIVDVFRRSDAVAGLVPPILEIRPRLVWLQLGVVDAPSARQIEDAGIPVVMDRCLAVDHQALLG